MNIVIRMEKESDFRIVEELTREAFWNLHVPGCDEHYLVHQMRASSDFIPELSLVAEINSQIVGNIMYTKSYILEDSGVRHETITFGPISVLPEFQRRGVGKALIEHSKKIAADMGYRAIIIYGSPANYCSSGFKGSKKFNITAPDGQYPFALLALEIFENALKGISGKFCTSDIFEVNASEAEEFDKQFAYKEKKFIHTQEEFSIASNAVVL